MSDPRPAHVLPLAAFAAFAAACDGDSPANDAAAGDGAASTDLDADGHLATDGDCNDRNDAVYPGARERSLDGVDSDCDGADNPTLGEDRFAEALPLIDADGDGAVSLSEFEAACARGAMVFGAAEPGIVQTHAACGGTTACRGMVLHAWEQLYEHDCRGVNGCAGWSCVEATADAGRDGPTAYTAATCDWCHGGDGTFGVHVPAGEDPTTFVASFFSSRTDTALRSAIAFGRAGIGPDGVATRDMPGAHERLSRAEMDRLIAHLRTLAVADAAGGGTDTGG
jgi:hypothetical protein